MLQEMHAQKCIRGEGGRRPGGPLRAYYEITHQLCGGVEDRRRRSNSLYIIHTGQNTNKPYLRVPSLDFFSTFSASDPEEEEDWDKVDCLRLELIFNYSRN